MDGVKSLPEYLEQEYFSKGLAACESRTLTDTIFCVFRQETFEFPSAMAFGSMLNWGPQESIQNQLPFACAKVSTLRKMKNGRKKR